MLEKDRIYARKCRFVLSDNPQLLPTFEQHQFLQTIQHDFSSTKKFYFKLRKLETRWRFKPKVTVIDNYTGELVFLVKIVFFESVSCIIKKLQNSRKISALICYLDKYVNIFRLVEHFLALH